MSSRSKSKANLRNSPLEQGRIHTLLDNFGFIYCADRPTDLFFHYSEVLNVHPDELKCGDEVQFSVGPRSSRGGGRSSAGSGHAEDGEEQVQLSAYSVSVLEPGTVQWETEVEPVGVRRVGKVELRARFHARDRDRDRDRHGSGSEGTIRLQVQEEEETPTADIIEGNVDGEVEEGKGTENMPKKGALVRYTLNDYCGTSSSKNPATPRSNKSRSRDDLLAQNDLVEFTLVKDRRSGLEYARNITMIQSERARLEEEREIEMLENATLEQGVVVSLKNGFGFLRSNKRREEVYFHFSHIQLPDDDEEEGGKEQDHTLKEGQEMEFLVVYEGNDDRGGKKKMGARQVKFLPPGTVVFEQVVAKGVTGVLSMAPRLLNAPNSNRRGNQNFGHEGAGQVRLCDAIQFFPAGADESEPPVEVENVALLPSDCRGLLKDEPKPELWFRVGDTLLFDVVRDVFDGTCHVAPTKFMSQDDATKLDDKAKIRLVSPTLAGRAEGIVTSMKDNYGFLQLAHRNADVYFRLSEIFPPSIQQDLLQHDKHASNIDTLPNIKVGSEVTFDLSLLPPKGRLNRNYGRSARRAGEKEQLRAQRLATMPTGTLTLTKESEATGFVTRVLKNSFTGQIRLDKKVKVMSQQHQYPLMTRLVQNFNSNKSEINLNFPEVQSEIENDIIAAIVGGYRTLDLQFIPVSDFGDSHRGRLCIRKVEKEVPNSNSTSTEDEDITDLLDNDTMDENASEEPMDTVVDELETVLGFERAYEDEAEIVDDENVTDTTEPQTNSKKDSKRKTRTIRSITFDKQSLSDEFIKDPPINGDKVSMTITFSRCTEKFTASNMTLLERNEPIIKAVKYNLCEGFVLLEPVHTAFKDSKSKRRGFEGGGWESDQKVEEDVKTNDDGIVMLLSDPAGLYKSNANLSTAAKETALEESGGIRTSNPIESETKEASMVESSAIEMASLDIAEPSQLGQHVAYTITGIGNRNPSDVPKRGDLVTFAIGKNGKARDVRVKTKNAATRLKGALTELNFDNETAKFQTLTDNKLYDINLKEIVSCDAKLLKENETVEALLHEGKLAGICRNADLYLETTITSGKKERPKLNLTVKKELKGLGGKIIAQSCMAKGPDGTHGFVPGWTSRLSKFDAQSSKAQGNLDDVEDKEQTITMLNRNAEPFVLG